MLEFIWDDKKNEINIANHKISFAVASTIFYNPRVESRSDKNNEVRWATTGIINGKFWTVVYTKRIDVIRLISARRARKEEVAKYHEEIHPTRH